MGKITSAIATNNFLAIKSSLAGMTRVFYAFGIFEKLITEEEKDERIFLLLEEYLQAMEKTDNDGSRDIINIGFLFKLLDFLGYKLNVEKCVQCGMKLASGNSHFFSARLGGVLCSKCAQSAKKIRISESTIKFLRLILRNRIKNLPKIKLSPGDIINAKTVIDESIKWITV